ncbi:hypothetical protein FEM48_Zijuj06G0184400 [Ziziphus jujuba var. spinosa]|uniref:Uncharacterized protein n=1 Tax=Ziziphus jujuba var. spinosa TaxID=714518 RepID=A0A978VAX0_ZIZJJ|nr:hypothetical protein FEM48_Zijuj06G0184400 [Ziziphus jujuba var. spinosa]
MMMLGLQFHSDLGSEHSLIPTLCFLQLEDCLMLDQCGSGKFWHLRVRRFMCSGSFWMGIYFKALEDEGWINFHHPYQLWSFECLDVAWFVLSSSTIDYYIYPFHLLEVGHVWYVEGGIGSVSMAIGNAAMEAGIASQQAQRYVFRESSFTCSSVIL